MSALSRPRQRRLSLPRISLRMLGVAAAVVLVLGCGFLWLRTSPLVRIHQVKVTGLSGPDVPQIRRALVLAAQQMTTLDVDMRRLDASVSRFPFVHSLRVSTNFPHGAVIHVEEQVPVATVSEGGQMLVVDSEGEILGATKGGSGSSTAMLPVVPLRLPPVGARLPTPGARDAVAALAAAPYELITHIDNATQTAAHGIVIQLRNGPQIYFGSTLELRAKWLAAVSMLNNSSTAGASYIDVSDPGRPAAGAG